MKKIIKTLSFILIIALSLTFLTSCGNNTTTTKKEATYTVVFTHDGEDIIKIVKAGGSVSMSEIPNPTPREHYNVIWDLNGISLSNISANITVHAWYTPKSYEVKWLDYDDTELEVDSTQYNTVPSFDSDAPKRAKDNEYEYTFSGWDKDITAPIEGDTTFKAEYSRTPRKYIVSFSDGETTIKTQQYSYGETPSFDGTPTKEKDKEYTYTFKSWDKEFTPVTQNTTYTAIFTETLNEYKVKFVDGDNNNETISEVTLPYGTSITAPVFPLSDQGYHYEWNETIPETITQDETFIRTLKPNTDTKYKVEVLVPKYTADKGDNKEFTESSLTYIDIAQDFKDILGLNDNNEGFATTNTKPDFSYMLSLPSVFSLDSSSSSYDKAISGDGTTIYTFKYNINWSALGFSLSDLVSGYKNGGYNHNSSYVTLGRSPLDTSSNAIGLKVHYEFIEGNSGNGTNFAVKINHLPVDLYESITLKYTALTADNPLSYWAARLMVSGENSPETNWPISGSDTAEFKLREFNIYDYLAEHSPELTNVDAIKVSFQRYQSIASMAEAKNTDFYILGLTIKEKEDNRTITYMNGDEIYKTIKIANGAKAPTPETNPVVEGASFVGWFDESLTNEYDFNTQVNSDLTLYAKFEAAVKYKIQILTEYYVREGGNNNSVFTFPTTKEYRDATSEFKDMMSLLYDTEGNYYYGFGSLGATPDFSFIDSLPEVYALVGSLPTDTISNELTSYTLKFNINESAIGYPLSKIKIGWANDQTEFKIGLFMDGVNSGLMIKAESGFARAYATPLQITFDNIDVNNYTEVKIQAKAKFNTTARNIAYYLSGETYSINSNTSDTTKVMKWTQTSWTNVSLDVKDTLLNPTVPATAVSQHILSQVDIRPAVIETNSFTLLLEKIIIV